MCLLFNWNSTNDHSSLVIIALEWVFTGTYTASLGARGQGGGQGPGVHRLSSQRWRLRTGICSGSPGPFAPPQPLCSGALGLCVKKEGRPGREQIQCGTMSVALMLPSVRTGTCLGLVYPRLHSLLCCAHGERCSLLGGIPSRRSGVICPFPWWINGGSDYAGAALWVTELECTLRFPQNERKEGRGHVSHQDVWSPRHGGQLVSSEHMCERTHRTTHVTHTHQGRRVVSGHLPDDPHWASAWSSPGSWWVFSGMVFSGWGEEREAGDPQRGRA